MPTVRVSPKRWILINSAVLTPSAADLISNMKAGNFFVVSKREISEAKYPQDNPTGSSDPRIHITEKPGGVIEVKTDHKADTIYFVGSALLVQAGESFSPQPRILMPRVIR